MDGALPIENYVHAARNCTQMLYALDRQVGKLRESLETGDFEQARIIVERLAEGVPQAIRVIDHDGRETGRT